MGQRSQIYVRINGDLVVANYYQWNYGERMVSRARGIIEWLTEYVENNWLRFFVLRKGYESEEVKKLRRICDVNFDMRDIVLSSDIRKEYQEYGEGEKFNDYVFCCQDNNDGQLYIDVNEQGIKYCFSNDEQEKVMDGNSYMTWDGYGENWDKKPEEYFDADDIKTCINNIEYINNHATLMTKEELQEFITKEYYTEV